MKKSMLILFLMSLLLFCGNANTSYADSTGSKGDITFVDGNDNQPNLTDDIQPSKTITKPTGRITFPSTGETIKYIWIVAGVAFTIISGYLLIIKKKFRRKCLK